jgi:nicotinamidase/pyrazinamidase
LFLFSAFKSHLVDLFHYIGTIKAFKDFLMITIPKSSLIASFDVDPQRTFTPLCPEELPVPEGHLIADALNEQAALASIRVVSRDAHSPYAVWIADESNPQFSPVEGYPDVDIRWKPHAMIGTPGFNLIPGLDVSSYDFQVLKGIEPHKHPYGACYHDFADTESTGVIEFLKQKGIETVLVGGLAFDYCVKTTALQLKKAGFQVVVNLAATRGIAEPTMRQAELELTAAGVQMVAHSDDLILPIQSRTPRP